MHILNKHQAVVFMFSEALNFFFLLRRFFKGNEISAESQTAHQSRSTYADIEAFIGIVVMVSLKLRQSFTSELLLKKNNLIILLTNVYRAETFFTTQQLSTLFNLFASPMQNESFSRIIIIR